MSSFVFFCVIIFTFITAYYAVAKFISVYALLFSSKINDVPRDWNYRPTVTVMMSAFNEGKSVYDSIVSIMNSDYPKELLNVVVFDDHSTDNTFEWLQRVEAEYAGRITAKRNKVNLGKSQTLLAISEIAAGDILISTDSDIIFDSRAVAELVSCFKTPEIGAVGAQCRIANINDSWVTQMQAVVYGRAYYLYKGLENLARTARCLTGQMVAFRREAYKPLMIALEDRNFLGSPITYGEDTYLTLHMVFGIRNLRPWKVFTNINALGWTGTPSTWKAYMNQQIRWRRGTILNGFFVLKHLRRGLETGGLLPVLICVLPTILLMALLMIAVWLIMMGSFLQATWIACFVSGIVVWLLAHVYNITVARGDPYGTISSPFAAGLAFAVWLPINFYWLTLISLFTLDDGGWVSRQNTGNIQ
jgi:hyaluronan synthase